MSLAGCAYGLDTEYSTTTREENKKLRAENERLANNCLNKDVQIADQQSEITEQARLLGISAEKELALLAKIERMEKDAERYLKLEGMIQRGCFHLWYFDTDKDGWFSVDFDEAMKGK